MKILFDVNTKELTEVEFENEKFLVFGHVQILDNGDWQAPTPYPDDGGQYVWDEETLTWEATDA